MTPTMLNISLIWKKTIKQAASMVKEMSEDELKHHKAWRKKYLNMVMDSTFDNYYSF